MSNDGEWLIIQARHLEINVGLNFVRDEGAEATANNTVPATLILLVKCLADGFCNLTVNVSSWGRLLILECLDGSCLSQFLHLGAHVLSEDLYATKLNIAPVYVTENTIGFAYAMSAQVVARLALPVIKPA